MDCERGEYDDRLREPTDRRWVFIREVARTETTEVALKPSDCLRKCIGDVGAEGEGVPARGAALLRGNELGRDEARVALRAGVVGVDEAAVESVTGGASDCCFKLGVVCVVFCCLMCAFAPCVCSLCGEYVRLFGEDVDRTGSDCFLSRARGFGICESK